MISVTARQQPAHSKRTLSGPEPQTDSLAAGPPINWEPMTYPCPSSSNVTPPGTPRCKGILFCDVTLTICYPCHAPSPVHPTFPTNHHRRLQPDDSGCTKADVVFPYLHGQSSRATCCQEWKLNWKQAARMETKNDDAQNGHALNEVALMDGGCALPTWDCF
jgi:hypothetical protein